MFSNIAKKLIVNESPAYYNQTSEKKDAAAFRKQTVPADENSPPVRWYRDSMVDAPARLVKASHEDGVRLRSEEDDTN